MSLIVDNLALSPSGRQPAGGALALGTSAPCHVTAPGGGPSTEDRVPPRAVRGRHRTGGLLGTTETCRLLSVMNPAYDTGQLVSWITLNNLQI